MKLHCLTGQLLGMLQNRDVFNYLTQTIICIKHLPVMTTVPLVSSNVSPSDVTIKNSAPDKLWFSGTDNKTFVRFGLGGDNSN